MTTDDDQKKTNELQTTEGKELAQQRDPYEMAATSMVGDSIRTLKYTDANWTLGLEEEEVPLGTRVVIAMQSMAHGRTCWKGGAPIDEAMRLVSEGPPPDEGELADHGPYDEDANEGWQFGVSVEMVMYETGEQVLFRTGSNGGRKALSGLARAYGRKRHENPNITPIASLDTGDYFNKRFSNTINFPVFRVDDWVDETQLIASGGKVADAAVDDLNDEIPY